MDKISTQHPAPAPQQASLSAMDTLKQLRQARMESQSVHTSSITDKADMSQRAQHATVPIADAPHRDKPSPNDMERMRAMLLGSASTHAPAADPDRQRVLELLGGE